MKCSHVALLLALVLVSQTVGGLAAEVRPALVGSGTVLLTLPSLATLRQADRLHVVACRLGDEPVAGDSWPCGMPYANDFYGNYCEEYLPNEYLLRLADDDQADAEESATSATIAEERPGLDEQLARLLPSRNVAAQDMHKKCNELRFRLLAAVRGIQSRS